jgi:hypothetical protein
MPVRSHAGYQLGLDTALPHPLLQQRHEARLFEMVIAR